MGVGRIKIILIALLILGACLFFFRKKKEGFAIPPPLSGIGYQDGTVGTFQQDYNANLLAPRFDLAGIDISGNDITSSLRTTLTRLKTALTSNNVILIIEYGTNFLFLKVNSIDLTLQSGGLGDLPVFRLSCDVIDKFDPVKPEVESGNLQYNDPVKIYYRTSSRCMALPLSTYDTCMPTPTVSCEPTSTSRSGSLSHTTTIIPPFDNPSADTSCDAMSSTNSGYTVLPTDRNIFRKNSVPCALERCPPRDCVPGEWSSSGTCTPSGTATCEPTATSHSGTQTQTRTVEPAINGGTCSTADSATSRTGSCSLPRCPVDCAPGAWTNSGSCTPSGSTTCESTATSQSGLQTQIRTVEPPQFGGTCSSANSLTSKTVPCSLARCPIDCAVGTWANSGTCLGRPGGSNCEVSATSISGTQLQTRSFTPAQFGGSCPNSNTSQTLDCTLPNRCPIDCVVGTWSNSGTCVAKPGGSNCEVSATSISGTQLQTRSFTPAQFGGSCPNSNTTQSIDCKLPNRCPINCVPGTWSNSGTCVPSGSATCESSTTSKSGLQTQTRTITPSQFGGTCSTADSATSQTVPCSLPGCPTNCRPGAWTNSGTCTARSGGSNCEISATSLSGRQLQTRIITPATNGGACSAEDSLTSQTIDCALSTRCPINCQPGTWSNSGTCMPFGGATCETSPTSKSGKQTQLREVVPSQFGGTCADPDTTKTIDCALSSRCPIPCGLSAWTNVGTCDNISNTVCEPNSSSQSGLQTQFQTITSQAQFGGACPIIGTATSNTQRVPCRLTNIPTCKDPFGNETINNLVIPDFKDFPMFGTFPYNGVLLTAENIGSNIASIF